MKIESIRLKNFKVFKDVHLTDIPAFLVVVGANGSGKSTLFDVFGFLHDCLKSNVRQALDLPLVRKKCWTNFPAWPIFSNGSTKPDQANTVRAEID